MHIKLWCAVEFLYIIYFGLIHTTNAGQDILTISVWREFIVDYLNYNKYTTSIFLFHEESNLEWQIWLKRIIQFSSKEVPFLSFSALNYGKINGTRKEIFERTITTFGCQKGQSLLVLPLLNWKETQIVTEVMQNEDFSSLSILIVTKGLFRSFMNASGMFPLLNAAIIASTDHEKVNLYEVYQLNVFTPYIINELGNWTRHAGTDINAKARRLILLNQKDVVSRRSNLQGMFLRCVSIDYPPYTIFERNESGVFFSGWLIDVWKMIAKEANFTWDFHYSKDEGWGAHTNGAWSGMVGELDRKEVDVAVAPLDTTKERSMVASFSHGIDIIGYHLTIRKTSSRDGSWSSYTMEMTVNAWIAFGLQLVAFQLVLHFVNKYSPSERNKLSAGDVFMVIVGSFCGSGNCQKLKSTPCRIVLWVIFMCVFVISIHYTSFLMSALAVASSRLPFNDLEGLLKDGTYGLTHVRDSSFEEMIKNTSILTYEETWRRLLSHRQDSMPTTDELGIAIALRTRSAHLISEKTYHYSHGNNCKLILLPIAYLPTISAIAFQKGSPLPKIINYQLLRLWDTGSVDKLWNTWKPKNNGCESTIAAEAMSFINVMTAFLQLLIILILSCVIFKVEKWYHQKTAMKGEDNDKISKIPFTTQITKKSNSNSKSQNHLHK